ncbi:unnamed protein product [Microthlaspi erraticum]|uniref:F-box domain-containing protein n=1 Tax=Microthlaspi erraticum TaxID=1685480 RepID=A0A6D2IRM4_9BRAS|nr:unnamed protein product [Microthlaspi erraticum]
MAPSKQISAPSLLFELVEEILQRTPIKALFRFKSVSKQWYALFNDKRFFYKHLDHSKEGFMLSVHKSFKLFNVEPKALLSLPKPDELHNCNMIHCDGLLLCSYAKICKDGHETRKLAVWNPVLSRVIWIEPSSTYKTSDVFGFGYDNVSRDNYKILRINYKKAKAPEIEIYEFKSKLWRSVNATLECCPPYKHVSLKGDMYWTSEKNKMVDKKNEMFIQSFDFSTETFKPICCVPNGICVSSDNRVVLSGFGGDRLAILQQHKRVKFEVWVTSKVGDDDGVVSWSKYYNASLRHDPSKVRSSFLTDFILKTNKIMLLYEEIDVRKKDIYTNVYEMGDDGEIKKQVEMMTRRYRSGYRSFCSVYVPSLVPVPE